MRKYLSFFRLRFTMGLQYRAAALAGIVTQFAWGFMEILMFKAFYKADASAFPMSFQGVASYIWLQQALLALFAVWLMENEIFNGIMNGDIAYEICRPIDLYNMWFARSLANRFSKAILRCFPILVISLFLPQPYGLMLPKDLKVLILMLISLGLAVGVTVAFCMLIYFACFFTVSPMGLRMISACIVEFFQGSIIPIPFFPDRLRKVMEILPFGSMQNVPFRIYSGDISGIELVRAMELQAFWIIALIVLGRWMQSRAIKKVCVQGG